MIFSFVACESGDDSDAELARLMQYKIIAKVVLDDHVANKSQDDYCEENWTAILQAAANGKAAVDAAINKNGVDNVVRVAKQTIDGVEQDIKLARLAEYKITAKDLIDEYPSTKTYKRYTAKNWEAVWGAVMDGKAGCRFGC